MAWAPLLMRLASSTAASFLRQQVDQCLSRSGAAAQAAVGQHSNQDQFLRRLAAKFAGVPEMSPPVAAAVAAPEGEAEWWWRQSESLLELLEEALPRLGLKPAPRSYRDGFAGNYRALFMSDKKLYRADVYEGCVLGHQGVTVNGRVHPMDSGTAAKTAKLQKSWAKLAALFSQLGGSPTSPSEPVRAQELRRAVVELDKAWADFEREYVTFLVAVERKERGIIAKLVKQEAALRHYEELEVVTSGTYRQEHCAELEKLVEMVGHLNSMVNTQHRGQGGELGWCRVYAAALKVKKRGSAGALSAGGPEPAQVLACAVLDSFARLRDYLREVAGRLDEVEPELSRNPRLVACLRDWEESWDAGSRYLVHPELQKATCELTDALRSAQRLSPEFQRMLEQKDAELFLVLPRLLLLCFLSDPAVYGALLERMLPHRFQRSAAGKTGGAEQEYAAVAPELRELVEDFQNVSRALRRARVAGSSRPALAWDVLVKRAVAGSAGGADPLHALLTPDLRGSALSAADKLLRAMESWSMELQQHAAVEWNRCTAVLVQCLTGGKSGPQVMAAGR